MRLPGLLAADWLSPKRESGDQLRCKAECSVRQLVAPEASKTDIPLDVPVLLTGGPLDQLASGRGSEVCVTLCCCECRQSSAGLAINPATVESYIGVFMPELMCQVRKENLAVSMSAAMIIRTMEKSADMVEQFPPFHSPDRKFPDSFLVAAFSYLKSYGGSSTVAIDNKIEQAMDLVKSHLMFAVREEVEVLKEQIKDLMEKIGQLEYENGVLKANATQETLSKLNLPKPQPPSSSS
ncbi:uncharacterized protein LOC124288072 isoform X4 [Haliotis rubra]|uniref:uncharacterized protein LOC124288072 isoform X4 n=1 Tax=Haliotis rubra TaxID=36100 RepID=UPI001EE633C9|nr:uncharacterized protein LOC124288072 isoform X4 [Haliotis rubra]